MNGEDERELEGAGERWQGQERLLELLDELLVEEEDEQGKREEVVRYCRSRGIEESRIWTQLVEYRQEGAPEDDPFDRYAQGGVFHAKRERLRSRIVELIGRLPKETLGDFGALLYFRTQFLQRIEYVCDLVVYFFLEREKGPWRESQCTHVYAGFLRKKLFSELGVIQESVAGGGDLEYLQDRYAQWIWRRVLDEEAPV